MTNSSSNKGRFNAFDLIIILLVVLCIAAIVFRGLFVKKVSYTDTLEVSYKIASISNITATNIFNKTSENDRIYLASNNADIGYIKTITKTQDTINVENGKGGLESVINPTKFNLEGTCVFLGKQTNTGFLINGEIETKVNDVLYVYTPVAVFELTIVDIIK